MGELKAIETRYKNHRFRSRLEARYAVFFDALGVVWDYEREGFDLGEHGCYLPDFWLPHWEVWWEVKPDTSTEAEVAKAYALRDATEKTVIISCGKPVDGEAFHGQWFEGSGVPMICSYPIVIPRGAHANRTMPSAWRFFEHNEEKSGEHSLLLGCPICAFEYLHYDKPEFDQDTKQIRIQTWCENGHECTVQFDHSKGHSYLSFSAAREETADPLLVLAGGDKHKLRAAIQAMTGARFEHGEHGEAG